MKNREKFNHKLFSRIARVERKCDRILAELLIIRQTLSHRHDMDAAIDQLHKVTRQMRAQDAKVRDLALKMYNHIPHDDDC